MLLGLKREGGGVGGGRLIPRILAPFHENTVSRTSIIAVPTDRCLSQSRIRTQSRFPESRPVFCSNPGTREYLCRPGVTVIWTSRVLGISILKTLEIWASPSFIYLAIWLKVRVTGDVHITRGFGNGDAQTAGTPLSQSHRWLKVLWEWSLEKWGQLTSMQKFIIQTFFWSSLDMAYKTYPWKNQLYSPIHPSLLKTISA